MRTFYSSQVVISQAVVQMQESLQQQVEQVSSLLEDQHKLPANLIHQATDPQVWQQVYDGQIPLWTYRKQTAFR